VGNGTDLVLLGCLHLGVLACQAAGILVGFQRRRLYVFLFAALAFYQSVTILTLGSLVAQFGTLAVLHGELIALVGSLLILAFVWVGERWVATPAVAPANVLEPLMASAGTYLVLSTLCMLLAAAITARGGLGFAEVNWQQARLDAGYADALATFLQFLSIPATWIAWRSGRRVIAAAFLMLALTLFAVYGSRAALFTLPAIIAVDLYKRSWKSGSVLMAMSILGASALLLHVVGRFLRGFGLAGLLGLLRGEMLSLQELSDILAEVDLSGGEAAIYKYFLFVVQQGSFIDVQPLTSALRWLLIYVPSGFVEGIKPTDVTYTLWLHAYSNGMFDNYESFAEVQWVVSSGGVGSLHPMLWGEMWVNGGWAGVVILSGGIGVILWIVEAIYRRIPPVMYALAVPSTIVGYLMIARGNSVIGLGYSAYVLPLAAMLAIAAWSWQQLVQRVREAEVS
jgi:hypothetical protein